MRHVCGGDYYFGPRDIHRDLQSLSSVPLDGSATAEGLREGRIHPYVMLSALELIS